MLTYFATSSLPVIIIIKWTDYPGTKAQDNQLYFEIWHAMSKICDWEGISAYTRWDARCLNHAEASLGRSSGTGLWNPDASEGTKGFLKPAHAVRLFEFIYFPKGQRRFIIVVAMPYYYVPCLFLRCSFGQAVQLRRLLDYSSKSLEPLSSYVSVGMGT